MYITETIAVTSQMVTRCRQYNDKINNNNKSRNNWSWTSLMLMWRRQEAVFWTAVHHWGGIIWRVMRDKLKENIPLILTMYMKNLTHFKSTDKQQLFNWFIDICCFTSAENNLPPVASDGAEALQVSIYTSFPGSVTRHSCRNIFTFTVVNKWNGHVHLHYHLFKVTGDVIV